MISLNLIFFLKTMLDLKNFCSMLVPMCLKQALSELQPFKATGKYMGGMEKVAKFLSA